MDEISYIFQTIEKVNSKKKVTQREIDLAMQYLHKYIKAGTFPGTKADAMNIGGLLMTAFSKAPKC